MPKYDRRNLSRDIEKRKKNLSSLTDAQLKKEVNHVRKLLEFSLPTCLRKRVETILEPGTPSRIQTEVDRFNYEVYWYQLMLDYNKLVTKEARKRGIGAPKKSASP